MEDHSLDPVVLVDHQVSPMEDPGAVVTVGDEDDKGMAAAVDDHMVAPVEALPKTSKYFYCQLT